MTIGPESKLTLAMAGSILVVIFWCGYFYRDVAANFEIRDARVNQMEKELSNLVLEQQKTNDILTQMRIDNRRKTR